MVQHGENPAEGTYVAARIVPMGWLNSVDLIQNFIRRFVFNSCNLSKGMEVREDRPFPPKDAAVICMDGLDVITKIKQDGSVFRGVYKKLKCSETFGMEKT